MSKRTNLDIKNTACLHIVHDLQHPISRPTTNSMQTIMVNALKKNYLPLPAAKSSKLTKRSTQRRHEGIKARADRGIAQLAIQKEACGQETKKHKLLKQWREKQMDWWLCWERNRWGKKASWRRRGSDQAAAGRYRGSWKLRIDDQCAQKNIFWDDGCYRRESEQYRKFQQREGLGRLGRWRWWRDRAGQAERRWWTRLGDGHNHQNSAAAHGVVLADADEGWQIDTTRMGGCSRLLPWKLQEVRHIRIEGSGSDSTTNGRWYSGTCTDNICRAYGVSWHGPQNIANAARDFSTRK